MKNNYIPIWIERDRKTEVWYLDVTNLSVTELMRLKEEFKKSSSDKSIQVLDAIIKNNLGSILPTNSINQNSYMRKYKKNKKEEKQKTKQKSRRRKYDKYKR